MAKTLFDYYSGQGQALPSLTDRAKTFESSGLGSASDYQGTAQQNTQLLQSLQTPTQPPKVEVPKELDAGMLDETSSFQTGDLTPPDTRTEEGIRNIKNIGSSTSDFYQSLLKQQQETLPSEANVTSLVQDLKNSFQSQKEANQALLSEQEKRGIPQYEKELADLNTRAASLQATLDEQVAGLEGQGRGITTPILRGQEARLRKQTAVELGGISTRALAIQGNITAAKKAAEDTIKLKYGDLEQQIENTKTLLDLNYQQMSLEQQKKADKLKIELQAREEEIAQQKADENKKFDLGFEALKNGASAEKANLIMESDSVKEALYNAGESLAQFAEDKLLTPNEAATLGVPYGTTQKQAAAQGAIPKAVLTPTDKIKQEFTMSKQVDSSTKEATNAKRQINIMETGYREALQAGLDGNSNNAPSQAVLITFQKLLDPTSVVRESEYARSGDGQSLAQRMQGTVEKLLRGGAGVTQSELKNFYDLSQQLLKGYNEEQVNTLKRTRTQAQNWGLNLENIITPEAQKLLEQDDEKRLGEYLKANPNDLDIVSSIIEEEPDISAYDVLRVLGTGFNQDLSKSIKGSYPEGTFGGQCTTFLHKLADFPPIGDYKNEKFRSVDKFGIKKENWYPQVGDIIVTNESDTYGHTAMINRILDDGTLILTESNYAKPEEVSHDRRMSYNSDVIYGAIRPKKITI